jgi:hypothetical protein
LPAVIAVSDPGKRKRRRVRGPATPHDNPAVVRDGLGRTHLVVHEDSLGRFQGLALARPIFHEAWQNEVAVGAANTTHVSLSRGKTRAEAAAMGRRLMEGTSKIVDGVLARAGENAPACSSGCAHCCYQAVGVTAPEVFAIYDHLEATLPPEAFLAALDRVRSADDRTRGLTVNERISPALPCPLLEGERCSVYEVRPLSCRGKNSLDADACKRTLHDSDARAEFIAGRVAIPCVLEPVRAVHAVTAGLQLAAHELHGLAMQPLELTAALRVLSDAPIAVAEAWIAGADAFESARGGDTSDDSRIRELSGRRTLP